MRVYHIDENQLESLKRLVRTLQPFPGDKPTLIEIYEILYAVGWQFAMQT